MEEFSREIAKLKKAPTERERIVHKIKRDRNENCGSH